MRIVGLDAGEVRTVAVSPDGRYLAASGARGWLAVFDWATGSPVRWLTLAAPCDQFAFTPQRGLAFVVQSELRIEQLATNGDSIRGGHGYAGGVAVSPDGRALLAAEAGVPNRSKLDKWALPGFRGQIGFEGCAPFRRLAFSPDGVFVAGIWAGYAAQWRSESAGLELRFAASGGIDRRFQPPNRRAFGSVGFVSFSHDSGTVAFGWEDEFHVLDTSTGTSRYQCRVEAKVRDAAFTGSGRRFATVDGSGSLKLWDPATWQVVREYDWGCGPLTCLAFTADGSAGVCGTAGGQLVQFDVDE